VYKKYPSALNAFKDPISILKTKGDLLLPLGTSVSNVEKIISPTIAQIKKTFLGMDEYYNFLNSFTITSIIELTKNTINGFEFDVKVTNVEYNWKDNISEKTKEEISNFVKKRHVYPADKKTLKMLSDDAWKFDQKNVNVNIKVQKGV
jgi:hypothetical protein